MSVAVDVEARNKLVMDNAGLVPFFLKKHRHVSGVMDWDDVMQEGFLGLMTASERYDASKGTFSNYANRWIRSFARYRVLTNQGVIPLPSQAAQDVRRWELAANRVQHETGAIADFDAAADITGITGTRRDCLKMAVQAAALKRSEHNDFYLENAAAPVQDDPRSQEQLDRLRDARSRLPDAEREIVRMMHEGGKSFRSIEKETGIERKEAASIYRRALDKLRSEMLRKSPVRAPLRHGLLASRPCHDCGTFRGYRRSGSAPARFKLDRFGLPGMVACNKCFVKRNRVNPTGKKCARTASPCSDCKSTGGSSSRKNGQPDRISLARFGLPGKLGCFRCYKRRYKRERRAMEKSMKATREAAK